MPSAPATAAGVPVEPPGGALAGAVAAGGAGVGAAARCRGGWRRGGGAARGRWLAWCAGAAVGAGAAAGVQAESSEVTPVSASVTRRKARRLWRSSMDSTPYPLMAPVSTPLVKYRCRNGYTTRMGTVATTTMAI